LYAKPKEEKRRLVFGEKKPKKKKKCCNPHHREGGRGGGLHHCGNGEKKTGPTKKKGSIPSEEEGRENTKHFPFPAHHTGEKNAQGKKKESAPCFSQIARKNKEKRREILNRAGPLEKRGVNKKTVAARRGKRGRVKSGLEPHRTQGKK